MVSRLYEIIEKDGLRDPYSNLPAVNFIKRESFVQKLHLHAQDFIGGAKNSHKLYLFYMRSILLPIKF
jgi:hypothetical protein